MAANRTYLAFVTELLSPIGHVTVRRMFGGAGIYCDGTIFALVADDVLYFKTSDRTRAQFIAEQSAPFAYSHKNGRLIETSYWRVPERLFEDEDELRVWAADAMAIARETKAQSPAVKKRRASAKSEGAGTRRTRSRSFPL